MAAMPPAPKIPRCPGCRRKGRRGVLSGGGGADHQRAGRNTGGEHALKLWPPAPEAALFTPASALLDRAFEEILRDLRTQYLIGYYPRGASSRDAHFHAVRVEAQAPGFAGLNAYRLLWRSLALTRRGRKNQQNQLLIIPSRKCATSNILIGDRVPVRVRLSDNSEIDGTIEFYDARFIRTRAKESPTFSFSNTTSNTCTR
jgi:hypothetical protein